MTTKWKNGLDFPSNVRTEIYTPPPADTGDLTVTVAEALLCDEAVL